MNTSSHSDTHTVCQCEVCGHDEPVSTLDRAFRWAAVIAVHAVLMACVAGMMLTAVGIAALLPAVLVVAAGLLPPVHRWLRDERVCPVCHHAMERVETAVPERSHDRHGPFVNVPAH